MAKTSSFCLSLLTTRARVYAVLLVVISLSPEGALFGTPVFRSNQLTQHAFCAPVFMRNIPPTTRATGVPKLVSHVQVKEDRNQQLKKNRMLHQLRQYALFALEWLLQQGRALRGMARSPLHHRSARAEERAKPVQLQQEAYTVMMSSNCCACLYSGPVSC
jgi:hypothetical protein